MFILRSLNCVRVAILTKITDSTDFETVVKTFIGRFLTYEELFHEYKRCAQEGVIVCSDAQFTPTIEYEQEHWAQQALYFKYNWFSLKCHANILDVILRLKARGQIKIARVSYGLLTTTNRTN